MATEESAFQAIKKTFFTAPVFQHFDPDKEYTVETDASDYVSAAVLSQPDHEGTLRPAAFMSYQHLPAECNYEIYDKNIRLDPGLLSWRRQRELVLRIIS